MPESNHEPLKPCRMPGCGGSAEMRHYPNVDEDYWAQCKKHMGHIGPHRKTPEEAAEAWNERTDCDGK